MRGTSLCGGRSSQTLTLLQSHGAFVRIPVSFLNSLPWAHWDSLTRRKPLPRSLATSLKSHR